MHLINDPSQIIETFWNKKALIVTAEGGLMWRQILFEV
jgi:hypothetical protein